MKKVSMSGPALFMNSVIGFCALTAGICLGLYYAGICMHSAVLWTGITTFTILFHFGGRILMGNVTKGWKISYRNRWFRELPFENKLYRILRVKAWKGKVLTYDPKAFDMQSQTLEEIATTMAKSETDHWVNEGISLISMTFGLIWGYSWLFILTALFAMAFDAQFIIIQRYNRPRILRLIQRRKS